MIQIDPTAKISPFTDIEDSIRGTKITIGKYSVLDSFIKIKPAGGMGDVIIGENVFINSGCVFYSGNGIIIHNNVMIAANCTFAPTNHRYLNKNTFIQKQGFLPSKGGILIESDVWIGANCVVLDGTVIHQGAVIGASSLIKGEIEAYSICAGNPLKLLGMRQ